ncbi:MAG: SDR family oxidoreductase [Actinomycetota bacterium]|nr:SDR family oxidoreductase [Actinomycetota bacterium]
MAAQGMKDLSGKLALVTGGGKGVGRVIARQLGERGADVLINCFHSFTEAKRTAAELEATGVRAEVLRASVAKKEQVDRMFDEIGERFGHLDILVNNAASGWLGPVAGVTPELFAKTLDTNLLGSFLCSTRAASLMAGRGGGTIVNISSVGAGMVPDNYLVVGTSKAALEALTRHLAAEYAHLGVRVNTASCSLIRGDVAELFPRAEEMQQVVIASTPLGRLATAEDLSGIVMFLTSDLSRWMTGQVVLADGGLSLANAMLSPPKRPAVLPGEAEAAPAKPPLAAPGPATSGPGEGGADDPVAIVGMGLAVPGASSPEEYWRVMLEGAELFVETPADRWDASAFYCADVAVEDKAYQTKSGFITGFQPDPSLAAEIDAGTVGAEYTTRWLRHSLHQALRGVGRRDDERVVFAVGYTADGSQHLEEAVVLAGAVRGFGAAAAAIADPGLRDDTVRAFREAAERHLWRGTGDASAYLPHQAARNAMAGLLPDDSQLLVVDTACSSSLYSVDLGMTSLLLGDCDVAVCGGAFALGPRGAVLFSRLHGLSTGGAVRSLDRGADGVLFSDGAGVVVLKRLSRATADGDRVLGVLRGFGSSSDGKGKAIYAPSTKGQQLAVTRAISAPGVQPQDLQWVVAHATGTPAGDVAEFTTLREALPADHPIHVTSNKSLIGHTGWAAGVVSLIEILLAFEHSTIPRQHRFEATPDAFQIGASSITIPTEPVPWDAGTRRTASISGFGFGGTNAHLVVADRDDPATGPAAASRFAPPGRVVIAGWSAHLPGLDDPDAVAAWLRRQGPGPARSFGAQYRLPAHRKVRIPPSAQRVLDRGQLMCVECMFGLTDRFGAFLEQHAATTGVLAGHMGPTGHAGLYALRCYLDDLRRLFEPGASTAALATYEAYAERVRAAVPAATEDAFPGIMPNIIAARVANTFDFHGLNMTVDAGFASTLSAIDTAARYLRSGQLDVALVSGVNGNSSDEIADILGERLLGPGGGQRGVAEGAVMFALVRETTAREHDLPILAYLGDTPARPASDLPVIRCGQATSDRPSYLGAEGGLAILEALVGDRPAVVVECVEDGHRVAPLTLRLQDAGAETAGAASTPAPALPVRQDDPDPDPEPDPEPLLVARHRVSLVEEPARPVREPVEFFGDGALVLTDKPALLDGVAPSEHVTILSTVALERPGPRRVHLSSITAQTVRGALGAIAHPVRDVRVLTDLSASVDVGAVADGELHGLLSLHDLVFLVLQDRIEDLDHDAASVLACLLGAVAGGEVAPLAGLFTGLLKSAGFELPGARICATVTSSLDAALGARQATAESALERLLPVAVYDETTRKVLALEQAVPQAAAGEPHLGEGSVVLACGGSRGITAELLKVLARRYRPTIYVLGSNEVDLGSDEPDAPTDREQYLRTAMRRTPDASLQSLNHAFGRLEDARSARANLEAIGAENAGRVTYLRCDVRDADQLAGAVGRVLAAEGRIDLVVNAAGINRSGLMRGKRLEDFHAVRDLKVLAYVNLKRALAGRSPLWCNFSSYIGLKGQVGETDYAAANDFVATASVFASRVQGQPEFAIGWNLWSEVGLGADPLMKSFLSRRVSYTRMATAEGVHHFLRELDQPSHDPWSVFMGDAEIDHLGLGQAPRADGASAHPPEPAPPRPPFYLGAALSRGDDHVAFERVFDAQRDPYLRHHVVNGVPTLPGTFAVEMAAEAATALVPDRVAVRFEKLIFDSFLRVPDGRPVQKKILASVIGGLPDVTLVAVRVVTDVVAPDGRILTADKPHFSCVVHMRERVPVAPRWELPELPGDAVAVTDPYHLPNPAVHLTGPFVTTRDMWVSPRGCRATFAPTLDPADPVFSSLLLPVVLLDGLLRVSVPDQAPEIPRLLAVPRTIRRLDLYTAGNDGALAAGSQRIELSSVPGATDPGDGRAVASFADGRVVAQIDGMRAAIVGSLTEDGEFAPADRGGRSLQAASATATAG